jgi:hypothetical protein
MLRNPVCRSKELLGAPSAWHIACLRRICGNSRRSENDHEANQRRPRGPLPLPAQPLRRTRRAESVSEIKQEIQELEAQVRGLTKPAGG